MENSQLGLGLAATVLFGFSVMYYYKTNFSSHLQEEQKKDQDVIKKAREDPSFCHIPLPCPRDELEKKFKAIQDNICNFLKEDSGDDYIEDNHVYEKGYGGGRSRVWNGKVIEKGGVNWSGLGATSTHTPSAKNSVGTGNVKTSNNGFYATGVSIVIHPKNPHIPTIHMNIRFLAFSKDIWWLAGGIDLTPYLPEEKEVVRFHSLLKKICEKHDQPYQEYKTICDNYFTIKHRNEMRGCSGIFFETLSPKKTGKTFEQLWSFVEGVGNSFIDLYKPFLSKEKQYKSYTQKEEEWKLIRRGRYAEFNLVYDKGTKFGLESGARIESILMSMPPDAKWIYCHKMSDEEKKICEKYYQPFDWVSKEKDFQ